MPATSLPIPRRFFLSLCLLPVFLGACDGPDEPAARALRLVDLFSDARVTESPRAGAAPPPTEWRFEASLNGWQAGPGTSDVEVRGGRLVGRSTSDLPFVHVEHSGAADGEDLLHAVEIRARVSAGTNMDVFFSGDEDLDLGAVAGRARTLAGDNRTPVVPEEEVRTYVIRPARSVQAEQTRHVVLRPTDAAGAEFEIESVRLVFRREHLLSVSSGIGWHGLNEVFFETVVSRAPETVSYSLELPGRPRLDLAVGTIEDRPVTFVVEVENGGATTTVLERSVTREGTVQTIDLMPTLLEIAGIASPEEIQGRSLAPLFRGGTLRPLPAFSFKAALSGGVGPPPLETEYVAMVSGGWKLVQRVTPADSGFDYELFDHRKDPLNTHDVALENPRIVERMAAEMTAWREQAEAERISGDEALDEVSAEELERLRSLGYVN